MGLPRLVLLGCLAGAHAQAVNGWTRCTPLTRILDCGPFLVCAPPLANLSAPPICRVCHADADCADMGDEMECVAEEVPRPAWRKIRRPDSPDQTRGECVHKLLLPMDVRDMLGFILIFFACAVAAGGGIGGGGMLVPILLVVFGFDAHDATPLSNVAILGGAVASCLTNVRKQHPLRSKPLIAYEVALMMEPMTMLGALVGTLLNKIFPGWLITLLLVLLLGITAKRTWTKGMTGWKKESLHAHVRKSREDEASSHRTSVDGITDALVQNEHPSMANGIPSKVLRSTTLEEEEAAQAAAHAILEGGKGSLQLQNLLLSESQHLHYVGDVATLMTLLASSFALSILRGRSFTASPLGIRCGSPAYWTLNGLQFVLVFCASALIRNKLMRRHKWKLEHGYPFLPDDVKWDYKTTTKYPIMCVGAGLCAGMFGIGGGIVKGPLMLEMGMLPAVASATSSFMILFTALTAALNYALLGALDVYYAPLLFVIGLGGTFIGQWIIGNLIKKFNKQSIIVLAIAVVIAVSAVAMGCVGIITTVNGVKHDESQGFHKLCTISPDDDYQ